MREQLASLALERFVTLDALDAPHVCPPGAAERLHERWGLPVLPPPHLMWWDASDDRRTYHGWEETRALLAQKLKSEAPVGLLGFSQGAMVAAAAAALSAQGELPPVRFVVCIGGRTPRADALAPAFARPLEVPSLHAWGERDPLAKAHAPDLADHFAPEFRELCVWRGSHSVPTRGPAADAIVDFVRRHAEPQPPSYV